MSSAFGWRFQNPLEDEKNLHSLYTDSTETLEAKLDECKTTQAEIVDMLQLCMYRKVQYRKYAGMLKIALRKRTRRPELPSEIWATIFSACDLTSNRTKKGYSDPTSVLCTLSLVCRAWREVVVSTPQLWIYLPVWPSGAGDFLEDDYEAPLKPCREGYIHLLQLHSERSGVLSLHLTARVPLYGFNPHQSTRIYKIWESALPRLESLKIYVEDDVRDLMRFSSLPQHFPNLCKVDIHFLNPKYIGPDDTDTSIPLPLSILQHSPLLRQADLSVGQEVQPFTKYFLMPWHTLTTLALEGVESVDFYRIVESAHGLTSLAINIQSNNRPQESHARLPSLTHNTLTSLVIHSECLMDDVLSKLCFPQVSQLDITSPLGESSMANGLIPLVNRSLEHIQSLALRFRHHHMTGPMLSGMLQFVPSVTNLVVPWCKEIKHLINTIIASASFLPGLTNFEITHTSNKAMDSNLWRDALNGLAAQRGPSQPQNRQTETGEILPVLDLRVSRGVLQYAFIPDKNWAADPLLIFLNGNCCWSKPRECEWFRSLQEAVQSLGLPVLCASGRRGRQAPGRFDDASFWRP